MEPVPGGPEVGLIRLDLRAVAAGQPLAAASRAIHAALFKLLLDGAADVANAAHGAAVAPLSIGPLVHGGTGEPFGGPVAAGTAIWTRIGLLAPRLLEALFAALVDRQRAGRPLALEHTPFTVEGITRIAPRGEVRSAVRYDDLARTAPAAELVLRFTSPTVFRRQGQHLVEPASGWVFGSYLRRWRAFAPLPAGLDEQRLATLIALVEARVSLRVHNVGFAQHTGFVGWARYRIEGDETWRQGIAALAAYAAYCGTGAQTPFGMGQTERVE